MTPAKRNSPDRPSIRETIINGPPERSRTRLPLRNAGAAGFCIDVSDGAEAEKAGIEGILSATSNAIAVKVCFVSARQDLYYQAAEVRA
jgi:hypothetical protein